MMQTHWRRVARLERAVQPYLARLERQRAEEMAEAKESCLNRLAIVALLLHGRRIFGGGVAAVL
jgi:hypothetical protein